MEWPVSNVLLTQVNIGQICSFLFLTIPGHVMIHFLNIHRRCWPKEDWDIQRQCTLKLISKKSMIFRSSLRYRPWGMLVGVSGCYPTKAVALLLGESKAYGLAHGTECISLKPLDVRSSMELPGPVVVQSQRHLHICLIWACPWSK